jgi:hypothetical protein
VSPAYTAVFTACITLFDHVEQIPHVRVHLDFILLALLAPVIDFICIRLFFSDSLLSHLSHTPCAGGSAPPHGVERHTCTLTMRLLAPCCDRFVLIACQSSLMQQCPFYDAEALQSISAKRRDCALHLDRRAPTAIEMKRFSAIYLCRSAFSLLVLSS